MIGTIIISFPFKMRFSVKKKAINATNNLPIIAEGTKLIFLADRIITAPLAKPVAQINPKKLPKTSPLSFPIANERTSKNSKEEIKGERIVCIQTRTPPIRRKPNESSWKSSWSAIPKTAALIQTCHLSAQYARPLDYSLLS